MKKHITLLMILVFSLVILCSCGDASHSAREDENTNSTEGNESGELSIYTIDYDNLESVPSVSVIDPDTKVTAAIIVDEVIANFKESVSINDIEENSDSVIVYFTYGKAPMAGVSAGMETAMLDCIAYSLLDNLDYCSAVYFRSNSGNYKSENIELENDEPYITK